MASPEVLQPVPLVGAGHALQLGCRSDCERARPGPRSRDRASTQRFWDHRIAGAAAGDHAQVRRRSSSGTISRASVKELVSAREIRTFHQGQGREPRHEGRQRSVPRESPTEPDRGAWLFSSLVGARPEPTRPGSQSNAKYICLGRLGARLMWSSSSMPARANGIGSRPTRRRSGGAKSMLEDRSRGRNRTKSDRRDPTPHRFLPAAVPPGACASRGDASGWSLLLSGPSLSFLVACQLIGCDQLRSTHARGPPTMVLRRREDSDRFGLGPEQKRKARPPASWAS